MCCLVSPVWKYETKMALYVALPGHNNRLLALVSVQSLVRWPNCSILFYFRTALPMLISPSFVSYFFFSSRYRNWEHVQMQVFLFIAVCIALYSICPHNADNLVWQIISKNHGWFQNWFFFGLSQSFLYVCSMMSFMFYYFYQNHLSFLKSNKEITKIGLVSIGIKQNSC